MTHEKPIAHVHPAQRGFGGFLATQGTVQSHHWGHKSSKIGALAGGSGSANDVHVYTAKVTRIFRGPVDLPTNFSCLPSATPPILCYSTLLLAIKLRSPCFACEPFIFLFFFDIFDTFRWIYQADCDFSPQKLFRPKVQRWRHSQAELLQWHSWHIYPARLKRLRKVTPLKNSIACCQASFKTSSLEILWNTPGHSEKRT